MSSARPFPFAALPEISRDEIAATRSIRHAATTLCRVEEVTAAIAELVADTVTIRAGRVRTHDASAVSAEAQGALFAPADSTSMRGAVLVHVEAALASVLVARALRQRSARVVDASRGPAAAVSGAFAALLHSAFRRAHAGAPLRVVAAGPAQALARDLAASDSRLVTASLSVTIGPDVFDARVSVRSAELTLPNGGTSLAQASLLALGDAPLSLPLVVATCEATRGELAALRVSDVLLVPRFSLRVEGANGGLVGPVAIVAPSSERGLAAELAGGAGTPGGDLAGSPRLVIRTERVDSHPWDRPAKKDEEPAMSGQPSQPAHATLEVLEDAPVVVRVELGSVELKAREWASLQSGDVITLGRKLGDPAILRVGGVEVARGELVQVDGEYGVRILRRGEG